MKIDFRTLSLTPKVPPNTGWAITEMPVEMIRAQLACGESKHPQFALTPVHETPHYRSLQQRLSPTPVRRALDYRVFGASSE